MYQHNPEELAISISAAETMALLQLIINRLKQIIELPLITQDQEEEADALHTFTLKLLPGATIQTLQSALQVQARRN